MLPLLRELYTHAYNLDLNDWILSPRARELAVAREHLGLAKTNPTLPRTRILHTFQQRYFADKVVGVGNLLFTASGNQRDVDEWLDDLNCEARAIAEQKGWDIIGETAETTCIICGAARCIVAIAPQPRTEDGREVYGPVALHCPACDLFLEPTHAEVARIHYGTISEDRLGGEAWANEVPR